MECGLTQRQVSDLFCREITPEDYELLCLLDEKIVKPSDAASSAEAIASMRKVPQEDFMGESCMVCLTPFEVADDLPCLPCCHRFHNACISRWLAERPGHPTCPLCCKDVLPKC